MLKKDVNPRLIIWVLLLKEFNVEIKDKKRIENVVANYLFRLEAEKGIEDPKDIDESFPDEQLFGFDTYVPWSANIVKFLACKVLPFDLMS